MRETKYCRACGSKLLVKNIRIGYNEFTGAPVSLKIQYCPVLSDDEIKDAYLKSTIYQSGYYHGGHFLAVED